MNIIMNKNMLIINQKSYNLFDDIAKIENIIDGKVVFVAVTTISGKCVVLCSSNDELIWRSDALGILIFDQDNNYKLDTLSDNDSEIILRSFSYYFILNKKKGFLSEYGWNK